MVGGRTGGPRRWVVCVAVAFGRFRVHACPPYHAHTLPCSPQTIIHAPPPLHSKQTQALIHCIIPAHRDIIHGPSPEAVQAHPVPRRLHHSCSPSHCPWFTPLGVQPHPIIPFAHRDIVHGSPPKHLNPPLPPLPGHPSCSPRHCPWPPPPRAWARSGSWCCRCPAAHSRWCPRCTPTRAKGTEEQRSSQKARPAKVYPHGQCL